MPVSAREFLDLMEARDGEVEAIAAGIFDDEDLEARGLGAVVALVL